MAVQHLPSADADGGRTLRVDLSVGDAVPVAAVREAITDLRPVTVVLVDAPLGATVDDPAVGWEIGVLTVLGGLGITDVRGADPVRARRVRAVEDELSRAAAAVVATDDDGPGKDDQQGTGS